MQHSGCNRTFIAIITGCVLLLELAGTSADEAHFTSAPISLASNGEGAASLGTDTSSEPHNSPIAKEDDDSQGTLGTIALGESGMLVTSAVNKEVCHSPVDPGPCTAEQVRYFYDGRAHRCRQFIYGGCGGNGNNFFNEDSCLQTCSRMTTEDSDRDGSKIDTETLFSISNGSYTDETTEDMLTLTNGNGETSFTFSTGYPFIQLTAVDISDFKLRFKLSDSFFRVSCSLCLFYFPRVYCNFPLSIFYG